MTGGRYITIDIQRDQAARYGLNIADVQAVVRTAIGGEMITQTVQGEARYPVSMRFPQSYRDSPEQITGLPIVTPTGVTLALEDVADITVEDGPPMIKSENARLNGWVLVDTTHSDLGGYVTAAQAYVDQHLNLPAGYSLSWGGQFEYMQRAAKRLTLVVPITLAIIILLLYLNFRQLVPVLIILVTLPFALIGGIALMSMLGFNWSVAVAMGFIALAGVAVEIGVLMLVYLDLSYRDACQNSQALSPKSLLEAVREGALRRLRPIVMTATTMFAGLLPILLSSGSGSQIMQRIAAPMIGGTISTLLLTLLVLPAVYLLWRRQTVDV